MKLHFTKSNFWFKIWKNENGQKWSDSTKRVKINIRKHVVVEINTFATTDVNSCLLDICNSTYRITFGFYMMSCKGLTTLLLRENSFILVRAFCPMLTCVRGSDICHSFFFNFFKWVCASRNLRFVVFAVVLRMLVNQRGINVILKFGIGGYWVGSCLIEEYQTGARLSRFEALRNLKFSVSRENLTCLARKYFAIVQ